MQNGRPTMKKLSFKSSLYILEEKVYVCVCVYVYFFPTALVNKSETLRRPWGHGAQASGGPVGEGGAQVGTLFDFLLRAWVVGVATLFAGVDRRRLQANITLSADHLVAAVFLDELAKGRVVDATPQAKHHLQVDSVKIDVRGRDSI